MTITKTLKVTIVMTALTIATFFMASRFSSLTMGSFLIADAFAQEGKTTREIATGSISLRDIGTIIYKESGDDDLMAKEYRRSMN